MPLDKSPGLNEQPEIIAEVIPERIRRELKDFIEKDLDGEVVSEKILSVIRAEDAKLAKLGEDRRGAFKRETKRILDRLKQVDEPDDEDYRAFAMQITLYLAAAVGGKVLLDPRLAEAIQADRTVLDALNASLVGLSAGQKAGLMIENTADNTALVFSWGTSAYGLREAGADLLDTTTWSNPTTGLAVTAAAALVGATVSSAYLKTFKDDVRRSMDEMEPLSEEDWKNKPIRSSIRQVLRSWGHGLKGGIEKFTKGNGKPRLFKSTAAAAVMLATVQALDIPTNAMGVGDLWLGTSDRADQIDSAKADLEARQRAIEEQFASIKTSTVAQIDSTVTQKLTEEATGVGEDGTVDPNRAQIGPIYFFKDSIWTENAASRGKLSGTPFKETLAEMIDESGLVNGKPLSQEVGETFDARRTELDASMKRIADMEDKISAIDEPERIQTQLNAIVAELDSIIASLNTGVQGDIKTQLEKYADLNRSAIEFAKANGGKSYEKSNPGAIEPFDVNDISIANAPIELSMEARSSITILSRMKEEMGLAAPLAMMALFLAIGVLPTNFDLVAFAPWTARIAQRKRKDAAEKGAEHFEPAFQALVDFFEHYLNKGTAARLLHTEPIDRAYIETELRAWMEEAVKPGGMLRDFANIREVRQHNERVKALKGLLSDDIRIMHSILRRLMPGMRMLEEYEGGDRVEEAATANDKHFVEKRKESEAKRIAEANKLMEDLEAIKNPLEFLGKAEEVLNHIVALNKSNVEFDESKVALTDVNKIWLNTVDSFMDDDTALWGASTELQNGVELKTKMTGLKVLLMSNSDIFSGSAALLGNVLVKLSKKIVHVAVHPHLAGLSAFKAPKLDGKTPNEAVKMYSDLTEQYIKKLPKDLADEEMAYAKAYITEKTKEFLNDCLDHIQVELNVTGNLDTAKAKDLRDLKKKVASFEAAVATSSAVDALYPADLKAKVAALKARIEKREGEITAEAKALRIQELNGFDVNDKTPKNINNLLVLLLGNEAKALAVEEGGTIKVKVNTREKAKLGQILGDLKADLKDAKGDEIEAYLSGLDYLIVANGGRSVLLGDKTDLTPGFLEDNTTLATDMFGNSVLMGCDHGVNDRPENQDCVSMNPHTGAIVVIDGMGGHSGGGDFADELGEQCGQGKVTGLEGMIEEAHKETVKKLNGKILDPNTGAVIVGAQLVDTGYQLDTVYAGDAKIYIFDINGTLKWASTPQKIAGAAANVVANALQMNNTFNVVTDSNPVEPGDRVFMATDGIYPDIDNAELGSLVAEVDLSDPASIKTFLGKLDKATQKNHDNRGFSLLVVE